MSNSCRILLVLLINVLLAIIFDLIKSDIVYCFLQNNIITIIITLLAINTATIGLAITNIFQVMKDIKFAKFTNTIKQMKLSVVEQIVLLIITIIVLTIFDSDLINFKYKELICNGLLGAILTYIIWIMWDIINSVFIIFLFINNQREQ